MRWVAYGPDALLIHFAEAIGEEAFVRGRAIADVLRRSPSAELRDFVMGPTSVLIELPSKDPGNLPAIAFSWLARFHEILATTPPPELPVKSIPVCYDGPDLPRLAGAAGLSVPEVVALHSSTIYKVYVIGFAPGFAYLGDLDPRLHAPRLEEPRPCVPAGSVAIGGEHTGIYPMETPGGWNLIGRTDAVLFDPRRALPGNPGEAFLLHPGDRVRFLPVDAAHPVAAAGLPP